MVFEFDVLISLQGHLAKIKVVFSASLKTNTVLIFLTDRAPIFFFLYSLFFNSQDTLKLHYIGANLIKYKYYLQNRVIKM